VRPIQSLWSVFISFAYTIHSIGLYEYGLKHDIEKYKVLYEETLDWGGYPITSAVVCSSVTLILMPTVHCIQYGIQKIRNRVLDQDVSLFDKISLQEREPIRMINHI